MTSSVAPPPVMAATSQPSRSRLTRLVAFTPVWLLLVATLASPTFLGATLTRPPELLGLPLAVFADGLAVVWMLLGVVLVWDSRSRLTESLALLVFTVPATMTIVFAPAAVLILQVLG